MITTKKALKDAVKNSKLPMPVYDSENTKTRKKIGEVVKIDYDSKNHSLVFVSKLKDAGAITGFKFSWKFNPVVDKK